MLQAGRAGQDCKRPGWGRAGMQGPGDKCYQQAGQDHMEWAIRGGAPPEAVIQEEVQGDHVDCGGAQPSVILNKSREVCAKHPVKEGVPGHRVEEK